MKNILLLITLIMSTQFANSQTIGISQTKIQILKTLNSIKADSPKDVKITTVNEGGVSIITFANTDRKFVYKCNSSNLCFETKITLMNNNKSLNRVYAFSIEEYFKKEYKKFNLKKEKLDKWTYKTETFQGSINKEDADDFPWISYYCRLNPKF